MSRKGWLLFISLCIIWGIPYLLIRIAVQEMSPVVLVFLRTGPAALLLLPLALHRGRIRALLRHWPWVVVFALVEITVPWLLLSHAEQRLSSSMAGLLIATVPLIGAVLTRFVGPAESFDARRIAGLLIGFAGVAALVGLDLGTLDLWAVAEVIVVSLLYAAGPFIISRRLTDVPSVVAVTAALALTALIYAPFAIADFPSSISLTVIGSIAFLAIVCTALAFALFFRLIKEVGPARSTVVTYVNPAVAILLGVLLLGEPLTIGMAIGFPLVLVGSVLATRAQAAAETELPGTVGTRAR